jgi:hypothetical protein
MHVYRIFNPFFNKKFINLDANDIVEVRFNDKNVFVLYFIFFLIGKLLNTFLNAL